MGRFSKPPPESGNGVALFATCSLLVSRRSCNPWFSTIYYIDRSNQGAGGKSSSKPQKHWVFCLWRRGGDYIAPFSATLLFSVTSFVKPAFSVAYERVSAVSSVSAVPSSLSYAH